MDAGNGRGKAVATINVTPQTVTIGGQPAVLMEDATGIPFTADQEAQACNGVKATGQNLLGVPVSGASEWVRGVAVQLLTA